MLHLTNRNSQIPGGLRFLEPATKWQPVPWSSFNTIVDGLIAHRRANPYLAKTQKWALDRASIEQEVEVYNASICKAHGWTAYYSEDNAGGTGGPLGKLRSPLQLAGRAVAGANVLREMWGADGPIKDKEQANRRAAVCVGCPKHDTGDWTRFFTVPAQAFIVKSLGIVKDLDLRTDYDDQLKVCTACGCPMKGKVWARLEHIVAHIPEVDKAALDPGCWILAEQQPVTTP